MPGPVSSSGQTRLGPKDITQLQELLEESSSRLHMSPKEVGALDK